MSFPVKIHAYNDSTYSKIYQLYKNESVRDSVDRFCSEENANEISCNAIYSSAIKYHLMLEQKTRYRTVALIIGTRPDLIKMARLVPDLLKWRDILRVVIINTGQHKSILKPLFELFSLEPDIQLDLMDHAKNGLTSFVSAAMSALDTIYRSYSPPLDMVIVQGDTGTAMAGALAAFYSKIPIVHIEAGLRTWNNEAPFPEEGNRRAISIMASLHLAPTLTAKKSLIKDGISVENIFVTGNTVIDAANWVMKQNLTTAQLSFLESLPINPNARSHVIVSTHRRENFGSGIQEIVAAVNSLAQLNPAVTFLFLVHLNPNVDIPLRKALSSKKNIILLDPVDYAPFLRLLRTAALVITDSGGMQEEAAFVDVPCIVLREVTERPEGLKAGVAWLVPIAKAEIIATVSKVLSNIFAGGLKPASSSAALIYGDGNACIRSACKIAEFLKLDVQSCAGAALQDWIYQPSPPTVPRIVTDKMSHKVLSNLMKYEIGQDSYTYFHEYYKPNSISVILTQYKRNTTESQLKAIFRQTGGVLASIDSIYIYQNLNFIDLKFLDKIKFKTKDGSPVPPIHIIQSKNHNFKFHGRFTLPLLLDTEYTVVFDDDTIPREGWFQHAIEACKAHNAIVGAVGMVVAPDAQDFFTGPLEYDLEVDYVGHSWVFRTEWARYLWQEHVPSWECCEDLGLSAAAWLHGRIKTIVPALPAAKKELWGDSSKMHHKDGNQSFTRNVPAQMRWPVTRYWVDQGWVPVALRNSLLGPGSSCVPPMSQLCQATFDILFKDKLKSNISYQSRVALSSYITVPYDPLTYVFGEDPPDMSKANKMYQNGRGSTSNAQFDESEEDFEIDPSTTSANRDSSTRNTKKRSGSKKKNKSKEKRKKFNKREL